MRRSPSEKIGYEKKPKSVVGAQEAGKERSVMLVRLGAVARHGRWF